MYQIIIFPHPTTVDFNKNKYILKKQYPDYMRLL